MLHKLLKPRRRRASTPATIPTGQRVYAIGDVHGRLDLLVKLIAIIDADDNARGVSQTSLIFLGDLVDRGPDSAAVIERLRRLAESRPNVRFLLGNHEEIFLGALAGDAEALRLFCRIGGRETAISYGIASAEYDGLDHDALAARLNDLVPPGHRPFLERFEDMIVIGDFAFVHAGVRPHLRLDQQRTADLRWIRNPFLDHRGTLEKMIVHGHTVSKAVDFRAHRIGVDTGAYASGTLSALGLERDARWCLQASA